jgi:hypothetical protein
MKRFMFVLVTLFFCFSFTGNGLCDPMEDLLEQFKKDYEAEEPSSQYSSVKSDYKIGQAALGAFYTTRTVGLLYKQNQELILKYDEMLAKYDQIIEQNREIIRLLSALSNKGQREEEK